MTLPLPDRKVWMRCTPRETLRFNLKQEIVVVVVTVVVMVMWQEGKSRTNTSIWHGV